MYSAVSIVINAFGRDRIVVCPAFGERDPRPFRAHVRKNVCFASTTINNALKVGGVNLGVLLSSAARTRWRRRRRRRVRYTGNNNNTVISDNYSRHASPVPPISPRRGGDGRTTITNDDNETCERVPLYGELCS